MKRTEYVRNAVIGFHLVIGCLAMIIAALVQCSETAEKGWWVHLIYGAVLIFMGSILVLIIGGDE